VRGHGRVSPGGGVEDHLAVAQFGHARHQRVGGIEHRRAVGQHDVDLGAQHVVELLGVVDVEFAERLGAAACR
jgi:hypothetical protein